MQVAECPREVVDRTEQQVFDGAGRGLDGRWRQGRLAVRREQHPVHAGGLRAAQERPDVVGILHRVEDQHERRLPALGCPREHVVDPGEPAWLDDQRHALVPIEPGERGQRPAFDLDDRDPQARGMQDELLERRAPLWHHEQPDRRSPCDERFLDRTTAGHEFLVRAERLGRWQRRAGVGWTARARSVGTAGRAEGHTRPARPAPVVGRRRAPRPPRLS